MAKEMNGYSLCFNAWALDKDIKNELGLLLIVSSLTAKTGVCIASNDYLADLFNTSPKTISRKIKLLEDKGYISIDYTYKGATAISRKIMLVKPAITPSSKMRTDHPQNCGPTILKNEEYNNISINNIERESQPENYKKWFLDEWADKRLKYLKQETHIKWSYLYDQDFNKMTKDLNKGQIKNALEAFFRQKGVKFKSILVKPRHFLENYDMYYTAYLNKTTKMFTDK